MKYDMPIVGSRWYKFNDPANKARIVKVTFVANTSPVNKSILIDPPVMSECRNFHSFWSIEAFSREFRPL